MALTPLRQPALFGLDLRYETLPNPNDEPLGRPVPPGLEPLHRLRLTVTYAGRPILAVVARESSDPDEPLLMYDLAGVTRLFEDANAWELQQAESDPDPPEGPAMRAVLIDHEAEPTPESEAAGREWARRLQLWTDHNVCVHPPTAEPPFVHVTGRLYEPIEGETAEEAYQRVFGT